MIIQDYSFLNKKVSLSLIILIGIIVLFPLIAIGGEVGDVVPPGGPPGDVVPPEPTPEPEVNLISGLVFVFCINFVINAIVLSVAYLAIKRRELIFSLKFLGYISLVTIGGIFIDLIFVAGSFFGKPYSPGLIFIGSVFLTFLGLTIYNCWLSRKLFQLSKRKAFLVGIVVGILTNPIWFYLYSVISSEVVLN